MNNNILTILASSFLVGFVAYNSLSKNTDIHFDKIEKEDIIVKDYYEEDLDKLAKELIDNIINQVCIELNDEYESNSMSYDICSICSTCSSFLNVEVD